MERQQRCTQGTQYYLFHQEFHVVCRVGAQQQMAKRRIDNVEKSLTNHPLALYPHLEKSMPIEVCRW